MVSTCLTLSQGYPNPLLDVWAHCNKPHVHNTTAKCLCPIYTTVKPIYFCCIGTSVHFHWPAPCVRAVQYPSFIWCRKCLILIQGSPSVAQEQHQQHRREQSSAVCSEVFLDCWPTCSSTLNGMVRAFTVVGGTQDFAFTILKGRI